MRRMIALTLISVCVASGAAACGAGGSGGSGGRPSGGPPSGGSEQVMTVLRQVARCIRSHGMPGWPDPVVNPLTNAPDFPPGTPRIPPGIQQACQSIASRLPPQAYSSQPPTAASMRGLLRFARCMRSHGVANWPDPNSLGEFPMTAQMGAQFKGQVDRSATSVCIKYVPGGSQYLQFGGTSGPPQPAPGTGNG
jgi:hypothetical protein